MERSTPAQWQSGAVRLPSAVAEQLAATIEARCAEGLALVQELRAHARDQRRIEDERRRVQTRHLRGWTPD